MRYPLYVLGLVRSEDLSSANTDLSFHFVLTQYKAAISTTSAFELFTGPSNSIIKGLDKLVNGRKDRIARFENNETDEERKSYSAHERLLAQ